MKTITKEKISEIINDIFEEEFTPCFDEIEEYLLTHTSTGLYDKFMSLKNDYKMMGDYWMKGVKDEHFKDMCYNIGRGLANLLFELNIIDMNTKNNMLVESIGRRVRSKGYDWSWESVRHRLEAYVTNLALAGLDVTEGQQVDQKKAKEKQSTINKEHYEFRKELFDYIISSRMLGTGDADVVRDILLSPTIDSVDQQLIVSAFTLNALRSFDINKFIMFTEVYTKSSDVYVRQRALVGWVLTIGVKMYGVYCEQYGIVEELVADEAVRKELEELQIQLYFCVNAEKDSETLSKMMPGMMKNSGFKITEKGIEEIDHGSSLDEILGKNDMEAKLEGVEDGYRKIQEMQESGSDIYFGGFSMMKDYPFFNHICNWFMPFYKQHPVIEEQFENVQGTQLAYNLAIGNKFCDSDRYSFMFTMKNLLNRIPADMLEMMKAQETTIINQEKIEKSNEPMEVRRNYLQSMFRFFKLYKYRSSFVSPFNKEILGMYPNYSNRGNFLFFENVIFENTALAESFMPVMQFLMKRQPAEYEYTAAIFDNYAKLPERYDVYMLLGCLYEKKLGMCNRSLSNIDAYKKALEFRPNSSTAKRSLARAYFNEEEYEKSYELYYELLQLDPDNLVLKVCLGACLTNMNDHEKAIELLYKCDYENPDNLIVMRTLGRALIKAGKIEQADKIFDKVLTHKDCNYSDRRYSVVCKWCMRSDMEYVVNELVKMVPHFCDELSKFKSVSERMDYGQYWQIFNLILENEYLEILYHNYVCQAEIELVKGLTYKKFTENTNI